MSGPNIPTSHLALQEAIHDLNIKAAEKREEAAQYYSRYLAREPAPDSSRDLDRDFHQAEYDKIQKQVESYELTSAGYEKLLSRTQPYASRESDPQPERPRNQPPHAVLSQMEGAAPAVPSEQSKEREPGRGQNESKTTEPQREMPVPDRFGRDTLQARRENIAAMLPAQGAAERQVAKSQALDVPDRAKAKERPVRINRERITAMMPPAKREQRQDHERQIERDKPRSR